MKLAEEIKEILLSNENFKKEYDRVVNEIRTMAIQGKSIYSLNIDNFDILNLVRSKLTNEGFNVISVGGNRLDITIIQ